MIEVYKSLIKPLRDLDTTEFLKRFYDGIQIQAEKGEANIQDILTQIDISTIRSALLRYKLPQVGFTKHYDYLLNELDEAGLRKLLAVAVTLWKYKGTTKGLIEAVRFLAGKEPIYETWFDFRWILGETEIGEEQLGYDSWLIGGDFSEYDENLSSLRLMNDGTLDKFLLIAAADLERTIGEVLEVVVADFIDTFLFGRDRWTNITAPESQIIDGEMRLEPDTVEEPLITVVPDADLHDVNLVTRFRIVDNSDWLNVYFYYQDNNHFLRIQIIPYQDPLNPGAVGLYDGSGTPFTAAVTPFPLYAGVNYKLRLNVENQVNQIYIKIYLDSDLVISYPRTNPSAYYGQFRFGREGGQTDNVFIDNVEAWRTPLKWALLKPNQTYEYSSSFWTT